MWIGLLAAYLGVAALVVGAGQVVLSASRARRVEFSVARLACYAREVAAHAWVAPLLPLGLLPEDPPLGKRPVILVPGYMMNRSGFAWLRIFLRRRGYAVWALNNAPFSSPIPVFAAGLAQAVDRALHLSGSDRVDIVGHSMGGVIAAFYCARLGGKDKVGRLITLGSPLKGTLMASFGLRREAEDLFPQSEVIRALEDPGVPHTVIWSREDHLVVPSENALPDWPHTEVEIPWLGHLEMLGSARVFQAVLAALRGPAADDVPPTIVPADPETADPGSDSPEYPDAENA